jgi:hypothetical protein
MDCSSLTMGSRLCVALATIPVVLWSLPLFYFTESHHNPERHCSCNNYILFVTFGFL